MNAKAKYLLAIESAISGGSIALFHETELITGRAGSASVSRAEDLLPNILELLASVHLEPKSIRRIAVSLGPGSYTGLRIGLSSVMGLAAGLGVEYVGIPIFEAISRLVEPDVNSLIALPMGKADICFVRCEQVSAPKVLSSDLFASEIRTDRPSHLYLHSELVDRVESLGVEWTDIGNDLAAYVGRAALDLPASESLRPIYIQNPRFG